MCDLYVREKQKKCGEIQQRVVISKQKEILELSNLITKIKNATHKFTSKIDVAEERTIIQEISQQTEAWKEKRQILQERSYEINRTQ